MNVERRKDFKMRVQVWVESDMGDRINVSEEYELGPLNFLRMCQILGQFHTLAEEIKRVNEPGGTPRR